MRYRRLSARASPWGRAIALLSMLLPALCRRRK